MDRCWPTPQPPTRECAEGCGRRRRTWREPWTCDTCLPSTSELLARARGPESMRATRARIAAAAESSDHDS